MSSDAPSALENLTFENTHIVGGEIGEFPGGEVGKEVFHGIQLRSIRWKEFGYEPSFVPVKEIGNDTASMGREPVPHENHPAADVTPDGEKETFDGLFVYTARIEGKEQTAVVAVVCGGDGADGGEAFPVEWFYDNGRLPARPPCAANAGALGITAFVEEEEGGVQTAGFFLIRGQSSLFHRAISASSRSFALVVGRWQLHPIRRSMRHTWPGL